MMVRQRRSPSFSARPRNAVDGGGIDGAEPPVSGTVIAAGSPVTRTALQRATEAALDLLLAMALVLAIPFAFAVIAALITLLINAVRGGAVG